MLHCTILLLDIFFSCLVPVNRTHTLQQCNAQSIVLRLLSSKIYLLNYRVTVKKFDSSLLTRKNRSGDTPAHLACRHGHFVIVKILIQSSTHVMSQMWVIRSFMSFYSAPLRHGWPYSIMQKFYIFRIPWHKSPKFDIW